MDIEEIKKEAKESHLKIETMGATGISIESSGSPRALYGKVGLILQSLVIGNVVSITDLESIIEILKTLENGEGINKGIREHVCLEDPTPEELEKEIQKIKNTINGNSLIKRKCLTCAEKDTCKNQAIDIKCNKY